MDFSKSFFVGKVKDQPNIGENNGVTQASFILVVNDKQPDANGQWVDNYIHVPIFATDRKADLIKNYVVAGQELLVDCRYTSWNDGQAQRHVFIVNNVSFGFKPRQGNQGAPNVQGPPV